jgi:hypothetical protein
VFEAEVDVVDSKDELALAFRVVLDDDPKLRSPLLLAFKFDIDIERRFNARSNSPEV